MLWGLNWRKSRCLVLLSPYTHQVGSGRLPLKGISIEIRFLGQMDMFGGGVIVMVTENERRRKVSNFNFSLINIIVVFYNIIRVDFDNRGGLIHIYFSSKKHAQTRRSIIPSREFERILIRLEWCILVSKGSTYLYSWLICNTIGSGQRLERVWVDDSSGRRSKRTLSSKRKRETQLNKRKIDLISKKKYTMKVMHIKFYC